jgi:hypothetical protein
MSRITVVAIASWSAALIAAGAFAYVLGADPPQPVASTMDPLNEKPSPSQRSAGAAMHHESVAIIVLPPTIITNRNPRAAISPPPAPSARPLSEMSCSEWRPLEQGDRGQMVRSCD